MPLYSSLAAEYTDSPYWKAPILPESSEFLAIAFLSATALVLSLAVFADKSTFSGNVRFIVLSFTGALSLGFGSVFAADWVGVYV